LATRYTIFIFYAGPPLSVEDINQTDICTIYANISWSNASTNYSECGPVIYDVMILYPNNTTNMISTMETSYRVTGLTPDNRFNVTVTSRNVGGGGGSNIIVLNTPTVAEAIPMGN